MGMQSRQVAPCDEKLSFEHCLRIQVAEANNFERGSGSQAPWEVVMQYVIELEKRVSELESKK